MLHAIAAVVALAAAQAPNVHDLKIDWAAGGALTGASAAGYLASDLWLKPVLAPRTCRWCDRAPDGSEALNALDAAARSAVVWPLGAQGRAGVLSDVDVYLLMPAATYGLDAYLAASDGAFGGFGADALIVTEAVAVSALLNQAVKFIAGRERPFVHLLPEAEKGLTNHPADNNLSFFSGHTTTAFSWLGAALSVAELRGYRQRWLLWAVALPLALAAPYLRMAADRHYLTDVLAGAAVGGAIGYLLPILLHGRDGAPAGRQPQALRISVSPTGIGIALAVPVDEIFFGL